MNKLFKMKYATTIIYLMLVTSSFCQEKKNEVGINLDGYIIYYRHLTKWFHIGSKFQYKYYFFLEHNSNSRRGQLQSSIINDFNFYLLSMKLKKIIKLFSFSWEFNFISSGTTLEDDIYKGYEVQDLEGNGVFQFNSVIVGKYIFKLNKNIQLNPTICLARAYANLYRQFEGFADVYPDLGVEFIGKF